MSESVISRKGFTWAEVNNIVNNAVNANKRYEFKSELITASRSWPVPSGVRNNQFEVRIFGGGGGGGQQFRWDSGDIDTYASSGGGGGWMNNAILTLTPGQSISILIGAGGIVGASGETTTFGSYLSANGGECGLSSGQG